jgi:signal transduction histidine kinase
VPEPATSIGKLGERERLHGASEVLVVGVCVVVIVVVRLIDDATAGISLGVFYVIPIAVAAIFCNGAAASVLAVLAAVIWSLGDTDLSFAVVATNSVFRSAILLFIVFILRALGDAARRARESERRSQEFLAFIAHQLRTPTTTASAIAQTLLAEGADDEREEAYLQISRETQRIGQLVSATLRYVRLDQDPHPRAPTDLVELCTDEFERQRQLAPQLQFALRACEGVPLKAKVSGEGVTEALSCLLDNARRHARHEVGLTAGSQGNVAVLTVSDDGPGLTPESVDRAFEPFVALDGQGGTGLGLAIARRLVQASGGTIDYCPEGFTLRFPLLVR